MKPYLAPVLCLLAALPALAQPAHPGPMPLQAMARQLDLSPAQHEQLQQLLQGRRSAMEAKRQALQQARHRLMTAQADPDQSVEQLRLLCDQEAKAHLEEVLEARGTLQAAVAILTPEQARKYRQVLKEMPLVQAALEGLGGPGAGRGPEDRSQRRPPMDGMNPPPPPPQGRD